MSQYGSQQFPGPRPVQPARPIPVQDTSPIGLITEPATPSGESKIKALSSAGSVRKDQYKRTPYVNGTGVCRVRTFHGKLSDQGLEYLDNAINEWLDNHPEVEVKFVTSSVGVFEGKMREPALVLNLWY